LIVSPKGKEKRTKKAMADKIINVKIADTGLSAKRISSC